MNGTLEDTTPAGVLQVLSSQHSTGAVRFLGASGCTVYLHQGELYFAESADTAEDLAVALVRPGRLSAEQWDASTDAGYPTETVGEALIDTGDITRELLASVVLSVIYDPLIQLFRSPEGDYEFAPDVVHWIGPYRTFGVDAIVSEVRRRTREADEMAPVVPSLDAIVRSARTLPESHGSVNLRRDDWEVVIAASTGCTVSELAVELGRGRWSTARIVYRLANADLLMVSAEDPADTVDVETTIGPAPEFGFDAADAPPPLDSASLGSAGLDSPTLDSDVAIPPPPAVDEDPWDLNEPAFPLQTPDDTDVAGADTADSFTDPWGEFDDATAEGDSTGSDTWESLTGSTDTWDPAALYGDTPAAPDIDEPSDRPGGLTAVPDSDGPDSDLGGDTDLDGDTDLGDAPAPPELHPDIAKALAESTYADSATAINAMAARLGGLDADDDDDADWDSAGPAGADDDGLFSDGDAGAGDEEFIWKPAAWDTGVEAAPLPQREGAKAGAETAPGPTPAAAAPTASGSGDPAWLDSLYTEFMPSDEKAGADSDGKKKSGDPGAAPKQRTLRRLMSAIRRL